MRPLNLSGKLGLRCASAENKFLITWAIILLSNNLRREFGMELNRPEIDVANRRDSAPSRWWP
jgi:hypothetical protein